MTQQTTDLEWLLSLYPGPGEKAVSQISLSQDQLTSMAKDMGLTDTHLRRGGRWSGGAGGWVLWTRDRAPKEPTDG